MAFDNVLLSLQAKKADAESKSAAAEKANTDAKAANTAVQDPALANAYMSNVIVATQAKNAMDAADAADAKLADAKARQVEANAALADSHARALEAKAASDLATAGIPDSSAHDFSANAVDNEARRAHAQQAVAKAEEARLAAEKAAEKARDAAAEATTASQRANQAASDGKKALRDGAQLTPVPPGTLGPATDQFNADSKAAKDQVTALTKDGADDAATAAAAAKAAAEKATADAEAIRQDTASEKARVDTLANRVNTPIVGPPGQSKNKVSDLGSKAFDSAEEAAKKANEFEQKAKDATDQLTQPPGSNPIDKAQAAVDEAQNLKNDLQPVYDNALKAAQQVPYDSDANAAKAKEAIENAAKAKKAADDAAELAKLADKELQTAANQLDREKSKVTKALEDIGRIVAQERLALRGEQARLRDKIKALSRKKDKVDRNVEDKQRKILDAQKAVERAKLAASKLPDMPPGCDVCTDAVPEVIAAEKRLQEAKEAFDRWKQRQDDAAADLGPLQDRFNEIPALLTENPRLESTLPAVQELRRKIREDILPVAKDMQDSLPALKKEVDAIKDAAAKAKAAADEAIKAKDEAVDKRIDQLMAEGHGPQRHEGQVTPKDLGERAVYKIDPESHLQVDAETLSDPKFHEVHSADAVASKFTSKETYVLTESNSRAKLLAANPATTNESLKSPLTEVGPENTVASGIKSRFDPATQPKEETSLGPVRKIPTKPTYAYSDATPPPDRSQMDEKAMATEIKANSENVDFTGGVSNAIYRKDTNGKWYLRTMWSEPAP
jgi:hypothetical protein